MERQAKYQKIEELRRSFPHCTASSLGQIMKACSSLRIPPCDVDRNSLRQARDFQNKKVQTKFGPLLQFVTARTERGGELKIPIAHPFALLVTAVEQAKEFSMFLHDLLLEKPSSAENPWHLLLYSDEVTPGNPLATNNKRKFQAIYWSLEEFEQHVLSHEEGWFTVCTEFSTAVNSLNAGMSQLFGLIIKVFMSPDSHNLTTTGILLEFPNGYSIRLFAVLGGFLQDGGAHKSTWHCRGDGSSASCLKCANYFKTDSKHGELVSDGLKFDELVPATSKSVRTKARYVEKHAGILNKSKFDELQQAMGITYHPGSLLLDRSISNKKEKYELNRQI